MKKWHGILALLLTAVTAAGLAQLRLDVDVFNLLPKTSATVDGLRLLKQKFGSSHTIIISLRHQDAQSTTYAAQTLASELQDAGLAKQVIWRSPFQDDPLALAEFLAFLWYNQPPAEFAAMARRFEDDELPETLEHTLDRMGTSLNPQEVARLARDPFSLSAIGGTISSSLVDIRQNPFATSDGRMRILYVTYPGDQPGFWQYRSWLSRIHEHIAAWQQRDQVARSSTVSVTGNPVFATEFGTRLFSDISWAAASTLVVVAMLFWWAHRRWAPLLGIIALLAITITITVALGGLLFGNLNAVSLAFLAILIGLAVDYGLILYQEQRTYPERSARVLRRVMAPSILWAAVTTAAAFALVSRSSLPGITQLGALVAIGILTSAIVALTAYVALLKAPFMQDRNAHSLTTRDRESGRAAGNRVAAWSATLLLLALSILTLINIRPGVEHGVTTLGFEDMQARTAMEEVQREITGFDGKLWLIIAGRDEREVATRLANAEDVLARAKKDRVVTDGALPTGLWPQPDAQLSNREIAQDLVKRFPAVQDQAAIAGFTSDSLALTKAVFEVWSQYVNLRTVAWPDQPATRWLFSQFAANDDQNMIALGQIAIGQEVNGNDLASLAEEFTAADGGSLVGWSLLTESLVKTLKNDVTRVVLPMVVALVVVLGFAYRDVRGITLSFATLGFMMMCLFAAMAVFGWSWNLMNITALPLLLGVGVDYSIHIQLALQRYGGDLHKVRRSVGNAILLCGASTAAGFGSLGFASNPGLASLGRVAALGIVIACVSAVFLLPVWWSSWRVTKQAVE